MTVSAVGDRFGSHEAHSMPMTTVRAKADQREGSKSDRLLLRRKDWASAAASPHQIMGNFWEIAFFNWLWDRSDDRQMYALACFGIALIGH